jgi:hypothetical protein
MTFDLSNKAAVADGTPGARSDLRKRRDSLRVYSPLVNENFFAFLGYPARFDSAAGKSVIQFIEEGSVQLKGIGKLAQSCPGDSGGPLLQGSVIAGVASSVSTEQLNSLTPNSGNPADVTKYNRILKMADRSKYPYQTITHYQRLEKHAQWIATKLEQPIVDGIANEVQPNGKVTTLANFNLISPASVHAKPGDKIVLIGYNLHASVFKFFGTNSIAAQFNLTQTAAEKVRGLQRVSLVVPEEALTGPIQAEHTTPYGDTLKHTSKTNVQIAKFLEISSRPDLQKAILSLSDNATFGDPVVEVEKEEEVFFSARGISINAELLYNKKVVNFKNRGLLKFSAAPGAKVHPDAYLYSFIMPADVPVNTISKLTFQWKDFNDDGALLKKVSVDSQQLVKNITLEGLVFRTHSYQKVFRSLIPNTKIYNAGSSELRQCEYLFGSFYKYDIERIIVLQGEFKDTVIERVLPVAYCMYGETIWAKNRSPSLEGGEESINFSYEREFGNSTDWAPNGERGEFGFNILRNYFFDANEACSVEEKKSVFEKQAYECINDKLCEWQGWTDFFLHKDYMGQWVTQEIPFVSFYWRADKNYCSTYQNWGVEGLLQDFKKGINPELYE